jgi:hypothetical protein
MRLFHILLLVFSFSAAVSAQNFTNFPYAFGTIGLGGTNGNYATITTDRARFWIDKQLLVSTGKIGSYGASADLILTTHLTNRVYIKATNGSLGLNLPATTTLGMFHVRNTVTALPGIYLDQTMANAPGLLMALAADSSRAIVIKRAGATNFQVMGDGRVFAREVEVKLGAFPDYVFAPSYVLMPLPELKNYIAAHKHLPRMPSAQQVTDNGLGLGELAILQTEKIEELTLHVIELNDRIESLEAQNATLKAQADQINELAKQVEALKQSLKD